MKNLRVALFVSELEDNFTNELCCGAAEAAEEKGYQLFIFPGRFLGPRRQSRFMDDYDYQNNCLFQFLSEKHIDIAVVNIGNIASRITLEEKKEFLEQIPVPVILVNDNIEGYSSVNYNNRTGMLLCIEHLINVHRKTRLGYLSGPQNNLDAVERLEIFEQAMAKNGIPSEQYKIVEGDFSSYCEKEIEQLLDSFPQMDALVCGNDMMCFGAYSVLKKRGIMPGKDIAVVGFDDVPYSSQIVPSLTTVKASSLLLGKYAIDICDKVLQGESLHLTVDTSPVFRESCGCRRETGQDNTEDVFGIQANAEALNSCLVNISNNILNYEEENEKIYTMLLESLCNLDVKSIYFYTFEKELELKRGNLWQRPEKVRLRAYCRGINDRMPQVVYQPLPTYYYTLDEVDITEVSEDRQEIPFEDIFANEYMEAHTGSHVVSFLYAGETQYGFLVWEIDEKLFGYVGRLSYQISNAIKTNRLLHRKSKMNAELEDALLQVKEKNEILEEISKVDELTQIYNRRGFLEHMKRNVIAAAADGKQGLAIYADMNNLKLVNDKYGHEEGDYSLRSIANMLGEAVHAIKGKGEVGRIGGDEFCAYILSDEDVEQELRSRVDAITEELNNNNGKPYYVSMSIGTSHFICGADVDISLELEKADAQLYEYKQKKRKGIEK